VLTTAIDVARAMLHLHSEHILHSDLKARNILLKSSGADRRGFVAKVADFGLSLRMDPNETHVSDMYQVRC
jgi:serine/threonine protein kinase